jgi:hypothetical protein
MLNETQELNCEVNDQKVHLCEIYPLNEFIHLALSIYDHLVFFQRDLYMEQQFLQQVHHAYQFCWHLDQLTQNVY